MEELKSLFGESALTYEEFSKKLGEVADSIELANIKSGHFVSRTKYGEMENKMAKLQQKYNALNDSTQGYGELQTSYETLKADFEALKTKQEQADKMALINGANVNPKFARFVMSEVQELVSEDKDFQTALGEYLKDNKEFLNTAKGSYVDLEKGVIPPQSPNEKMNSFIRGKLKNGI